MPAKNNSMVRILHLADLHLGELPHNPPAGADSTRSRFQDLLNTLDSAVELAVSTPVDALLIAGDAFNSPHPSPLHLRELAIRLRRLLDANIPIVAIPGNHDSAPRPGKACPLEALSALGVPGFHLATSPRLLTVELAHGKGPLYVLALPWPSRSWLGEDLSRASDVNQALKSTIISRVSSLSSKIPPERPSLLLAHISLAGSKLSDNLPAHIGGDIPFPPSRLLPKPLLYGALGHHHHHQALSTPDRRPLVYAGSPAPLSFAEGGQTKGCVLVTIAEGKADWEFVPLPGRPLRQLVVDLRGKGEPFKVMEQALQDEPLGEAILRIKVRIGEEEETLDWKRMKEVVQGKKVYHFTGFQMEREQSRRAVPSAINPRLPVLSALEEFFGDNSRMRSRKKALLELAEELLRRIRGSERGARW